VTARRRGRCLMARVGSLNACVGSLRACVGSLKEWAERLLLACLVPAALTAAAPPGEGGPDVQETAVRASAELPLESALRDALRGEFERQGLVGLAVGVVVDGRIEELYFGLADRAAGTPVGPDTMFRWASISKPLVAVRAVQLARAGEFDLDADVRELVPEFPEKPWPVTPRQLAGHLGGIVHYSNGEVIRTEREYGVAHPFVDEVLALDAFKASPLLFEPGTRYSYTTHGYMLLGAAVARAGGAPLRDQIAAGVAAPLGMATLRPDYQWEEIPGRARGYRRAGPLVVPSGDSDVSWKLAGGGFISTVGDLARFARGLMGEELLPREALDRMWTPLTLRDGEQTRYGLGFGVGRAGEERVIRHSGSQQKTRTFLSVRPDSGRAVVVMTNSEFARTGPIVDVAWAVLDARR